MQYTQSQQAVIDEKTLQSEIAEHAITANDVGHVEKKSKLTFVGFLKKLGLGIFLGFQVVFFIIFASLLGGVSREEFLVAWNQFIFPSLLIIRHPVFTDNLYHVLNAIPVLAPFLLPVLAYGIYHVKNGSQSNHVQHEKPDSKVCHDAIKLCILYMLTFLCVMVTQNIFLGNALPGVIIASESFFFLFTMTGIQVSLWKKTGPSEKILPKVLHPANYMVFLAGALCACTWLCLVYDFYRIKML